MRSLNKKASCAQCFIMDLGLFWDIVTGLPWTPNGVGSLEPRGYCILLTINNPHGADSSLNKLLLLLLWCGTKNPVFSFLSNPRNLNGVPYLSPQNLSQYQRANDEIWMSLFLSGIVLLYIGISFSNTRTMEADDLNVAAPPHAMATVQLPKLFGLLLGMARL